MRQAARVEDHRFLRVSGLVNPFQQFGFAVALPHNGFEPEFGGVALDQRDQLVVGGAAVDVGFALAEPAQIRAVDHIYRGIGVMGHATPA